MNYQVLLYYKYTDIKNPAALREEQLQLGEMLGLRGRIIVAHEGINGTVSGLTRATQAYMETMNGDERFQGMIFKMDSSMDHTFTRLSLRNNKVLRLI